ncbi:MAG: NADH:flavin oxidoreductase/NADH oxidase, partial [Actinomycetia bacterium]|nr:NADH:flavin oxidoreductase/NADH oxidase [Actinomycetes bacterium]
PNCCGLWNDAQRDAWARVVTFVRAQGAAMGIQLGHAGRKASAYSEMVGKPGTVPAAEGGWETVAPSPIAFPGYAVPREATVADLHAIAAAFAAAARRADEAGFDVVELHAAHGYLLSETLSPLTNHRTDKYGGSFAGRTRFLLETIDAVRSVWPASKPLFVRISATEWVDGGWTIDDTIRLAGQLKEHGVDFLDVSSGGNVPASITGIGPGYQVPLARQASAGGLPTSAVGLITEPAQAQRILDEGGVAAIQIGRAGLRMPAWPQWAAHVLGIAPDDAPYPPSYRRGRWPVEAA